MRLLTVLLVEQSDDNAELTIRALLKSKLTAEIDRLKTGGDVKNYLFGETPTFPDLILMDWALPQINGIDLLRAIRLKESMNSVAVALLLSTPSDQKFVEKQGVTADGYLLKPINTPAFCDLVMSLDRLKHLGSGNNL